MDHCKNYGRLYTREIARIKSLPVAAKHVYTAFRCLLRFDNDTGTFPYSTAMLVEITHLAPNTVRAACRLLEDEGLLQFYGTEASLPLYNECRVEEDHYTYVPSVALEGLARYVRAGLGAYYDLYLQIFNQLRVKGADPHYTYDTLCNTYRLGNRPSRIRKYLSYLGDVVVFFPGCNPKVLHFRYAEGVHATTQERAEWNLKREMKETVRKVVPSHLNAVVARMWDFVKERKLKADIARRVAQEFVVSVIDLGESLKQPVAFTMRFLERFNLNFYLQNAA